MNELYTNTIYLSHILNAGQYTEGNARRRNKRKGKDEEEGLHIDNQRKGGNGMKRV